MMNIPQTLYVDRPKFEDERGFLNLMFCNTAPIEIDGEILGCPDQVIITKTNKFTGRGLHFQKQKPLLQVVSVLSGEIIECLISNANNNLSKVKFSSKITYDSNLNTFLIPRGWAHGFYTLSKPATLLYFVWGERRLEDEHGINLKHPDLGFVDAYLSKKINMNERDSNYELY